MNWPLPYMARSLLAPCLFACALLQVGACSEQGPESALVLSGDERLQDGVLKMDERDIQARFVDAGLWISFVVHSSAPLDLASQAALSLRDLNDNVFASGQTDIEQHDGTITISALLNPAPQLATSAAQANYVIHGTLRSGGRVLRFRRSLYTALNHVDFRVANPSALMPGQDFPLLASFAQNTEPNDAPTKATLWLSDPAIDDGDAAQLVGEEKLTAQNFSAQGLQVEQYSLDPTDSAGSRISLHMSQEPAQADLNTGYNNVLQLAHLTAKTQLRAWPQRLSLTAGKTFRALINLRQRQGHAIAGQSGRACFRQNNLDLFCQDLQSDARGLALIEWPTARGLVFHSDIFLHLDFGPAHLVLPIDIKAQQREHHDLDVVIDSTWADAEHIYIRGKIPGAQGLRYHLELRADDVDGPLLSERDGWLQNEDLHLQLAIPLAAHLAPKQWYVLIGVEDAYGRRHSRGIKLLPSAEGLAMQVWTPQHVTRGRDFALLLATRNSQGQPQLTTGTLRINNNEQRSFVSDENGLALLTGLRVDADQADLVLSAQDNHGREAQWQKLLQLDENAPANWPWTQPLQIGANDTISLQSREDSQLRPLAAWLSDDDMLIDSAFADGPVLLEPGLTKRQHYWLNSLALDVNNQLVAQSQLLMAAHPMHFDVSVSEHNTKLNLVDTSGANRPASFVQLRLNSPSPLPYFLPDFLSVAQQAAADPIASALVQQALQVGAAHTRGLKISLAGDEALRVRDRAEQQVAADLNAIFSELAFRIHDNLVDSAEIGTWVQRHAQAYYDPWGQSYLLSLKAGQLRLQSLGLDEEPDSGDELQASRFIHGLIMTPAADDNPAEQQRSWKQSLAAEAFFLLGDDENQQTLRAQTKPQVLAFSDDGQSLQQSLPSLAIKAFVFPQELRLRTGDRLSFDLAIYAPGALALHLDWQVENPEALRLQTATELSPGRDGWAHARVDVQALQNQEQTINLTIRSAEQQVQQLIKVWPRDRDADLGIIDSWCAWPKQAQNLLLDASGRSLRQQPVLHARVWPSGSQMASFLAEQSLKRLTLRSLQSVDDSALFIAARSYLEETQKPQLNASLMYMGNLLRDDGGFAAQAQENRASFASSLSVLESLQRLQLDDPADLRQSAWFVHLSDYFVASLQSDGGLAAEGISGDTHSLRRQRLRHSARLLAAIGLLSIDEEQVQKLRNFVQNQAVLLNDPLALALALRALRTSPDLAHSDIINLREALWSLQYPLVPSSEGEDFIPAHAGLFMPLLNDGDLPEQQILLTNALVLQALLPDASTAERHKLTPALNHLLTVCSAKGISAAAHVQIEILRALQLWPASEGALVIDDGTQQRRLDAQQGHLSWSIAPNQSLHLQTDPSPLLSMVWLEARPALPIHAKIQLQVLGPALLSLRRGQTRAYPLLLTLDDLPETDSDDVNVTNKNLVHLWSEGSSCADLALQIGEKRHVFSADQGLDLLLSREDLNSNLQVWLYPQHSGTCAMPLLRAVDLRHPGLISTSGAHNLVIE